MFIGRYEHAIDKKGRLVMPSKFRETFQEHYLERFVLTKWFDQCLRLFPIQEWTAFEKKLAALPQTDANARYVQRVIFASAVDVEIDKQGRIFLPLPLRAMVGIGKDVVILGLNQYVELWDRNLWMQYHKETDRPIETVAQHLTSLGIF